MRSNGKYLYLMALAFVLTLSMVLPVQADNSYISIREMRDNAPSTWTESLKGGKKNFDCTIDAAIVVPEVEHFPILRVAYQGETQGLDKKGYFIEENTEKIMMVKTIPDELLPDIGSSEIFARYEDSLDEETILQAEEKARGILHNVWDIDSLNIERIGAVEFYNADSTFRDFSVYFCPVYHNIPYLMCPYAFYDVKGYSPMPQNLIHAFWRENIEFEGAGISIPRVIGEHVQDVPLLPFSEIQESIRQRIQEGYIQSICEIRLGYICCNNPEHPGEEFYLTPAWVVCGVMNSLPNLPFYPQEYTPEQRYTASTSIINAQTGEAMDFHSHSKKAFEAHILTWDDVRQ